MIDANVIIYILVGVVVILVTWIITLELRLKKFFYNDKSKNLNSVLSEIQKKVEKLGKNQEEIGKYLEEIEKRLQQTVNQPGIVRFNPFSDAGSNQSFAIALLNEARDGVVISSLYSREKVNIYAKPIKNGLSEYQLTDEEKEAIKLSSQITK